MAQVVYGLSCDHGDGSAGIRWFKDKELVDRLLDEDGGFPDYVWESYCQNEGSPAQTLTFPDDLDLAACGFRFGDDDAREYLED